MFSRFGMHLQAENHKKCMVYRVWTSGNLSSESANVFLNKSKNLVEENIVSNLPVGNLDASRRSSQILSDYDPSASEVDVASPGKMINSQINTEVSHGIPGDGESNSMLLGAGNSFHEPRDTVSAAELNLVSTRMETNVASSETPPLAVLKPLNSGSYQRYPCLTLTVDGARREQRIIERLQVRVTIHFLKASFWEEGTGWVVIFIFYLLYIFSITISNMSLFLFRMRSSF
jgi:general transcription factor 3C polypeptide 1